MVPGLADAEFAPVVIEPETQLPPSEPAIGIEIVHGYIAIRLDLAVSPRRIYEIARAQNRNS